MGDLKRTFGKRLRELRKSAGLTQEQLAQRAGMAYKYLGALERAEINPTLLTIGKIADALEVSAHELLRGEMNRKPPQETVDSRTLINLMGGCNPRDRSKIIRMVRIAVTVAKRKK